LLLDRISVGGMAEVFKAKSYGVEGFEKIIAIKRILPTMGEDRDFIKMFIDEAKIAGQLAHANICQIFELGRIDGSHFIAMEYIWGKDLLQIQNRLRKIKQPMPVAMACFTIAKVLEGLDYAHRKRDPLGRPLEIVHRDCSPQNVLVSYEGEVKIIDFGIAKATSRNSRTMAGVLKGKFGYMSPEQVRGLPLDRRSDIFALGTMLYECLTGDRLFQGETDFSTLEKVRNVDIRPPRELNPMIPQAVEAVILKALAKDVEDRYQWCSEMLADIQAFLMAQEVVFTAKSLSSWLKEVFSSEIDRERQQLEQYKRVGRDGLIAGVPAAEAKLDVVETLGEAGPVEGDPTMLGGPSFDDVEPPPAEVGPAPGSPAAIGAPPPPVEDDDEGEPFGEEAQTEIFGEIDHSAKLPGEPPSTRAPTSQQPATRPPRPPPGSRPPTSRGEPAPRDSSPVMYGPPPPPPGPQAVPMSPQPIALAPPLGPGQPSTNGSAPTNQSQGRTLLGAAPVGVPNYAHGYPPQNAQGAMPPGYPPQGYPQSPHMQPPYSAGPPPGYPPYGMPPGQGPPMYGQPMQGQPTQGPPMYGQPMQGQPTQGPMYGQPMQGQPMQGQPMYGQPMYGQPMQGQPMHGQPMQGQPMHGQPMQGQPYPPYPGQPIHPSPSQGYPYPQGPSPYGPSGPHGAGVPPTEPQVDSKRRSSIVRDVAIGVAIAALVLGGFLAVKFLILDSDSPPEPAPTTSIAMIRLAMPSGVTADLFVDNKKVATVSDQQEIPVSAGQRTVKLIGPSGTRCEQSMTLAAGKTTTLECAMAAPAVGSDGSAAAGSNDGKSSSATPAVPDHPVPDKTDKMPIEEPATPTDRAGKSPDKPAGTDDRTSAKTLEHASKTPDKPGDKTPDKPGDKTLDKPGDRTLDKPVDKAAAKPPDKLSEKTPEKAPDKPSDKPALKTERPADKPKATVDDDPLGKLQGGIKPGDKHAARTDAKGYLNVSNTTAAKILVDGDDTGLTTPITGHTLPLSPGVHKVTFLIRNDKVTFSVMIAPGETAVLQKDLR
jgi:serine/threonine protein kinase